MVLRLSLIKFRDCLHSGLLKRGVGTALIEAKLAQQLAWRDHCPLYKIYLDLKKAYNAIDQGCMLEILEAYGVGPNFLRLQNSFWKNTKLVCRAGGS
jgi:hypothetical protein